MAAVLSQPRSRGRGRRRPIVPAGTIVLVLAAAVLPACTRTGGARPSAPGGWAAATRQLVTGALRTDPDGPTPLLDLPADAPAGLFDRAGARLALGRSSDPKASSAIAGQLAAAFGPDGVVEDPSGPTEVLTWYALRLAPVPGAEALAAADRQHRGAMAATARTKLEATVSDPFTAVFWARVVRRAGPAPAGVAGEPLRLEAACAAAPRGQVALPSALMARAVAQEIAGVGGRRCAAVDPVLAEQVGDWLPAQAAGGELDAEAVGALAAVGDLATVGDLDARLGRAADDVLAAGLARDQVEATPSVVLLAVDRLGRAGRPAHLGPDLRARLRAIVEGTTSVLLQPSALRILAVSDVARLTGGDAGGRIRTATRWDDRRLDPLDRLVLAVAAHDADHVDLRALRTAAPGPTVAVVAARAQRLVGGRCDPDVARYLRRTVAEIERTGAPSARNPYTASGYAALLRLAGRCGLHDDALARLRAVVLQHLRTLRSADGTYGPDGAADLRLTATLEVASCRLGRSTRPAGRRAVAALTAPVRRPGGGAAVVEGPVSVDDTLAVATLDAIARSGCEVVR